MGIAAWLHALIVPLEDRESYTTIADSLLETAPLVQSRVQHYVALMPFFR